jgi:glycosyltransferase involved in cell wall biosynthesis
MKLKVIHIMDHPPVYTEFSNKEKPEVHWNLSGGKWVGFLGIYWGDYLGKEIIKVDPEITFEVWQPDLRADKVYSHTFNGGWTHLLFPAEEISYWYGIKKQKYLASDSLIELLGKSITCDTILHLPFPDSPMIQSVIRKFKDIRIVCLCLGDLPLPSLRFLKLNKNFLSKINLVREHFIIKELMFDVNAFTVINNNYITQFKKLYSGPFSIIPMGVDLNYWHPKDKAVCRTTLNLPQNKTILFSSSRLNSLKQVEKLIHILNKLSSKYDFLFVVSGHGTRSYEDYLIRQAQPMVEGKQILFTGYVLEEELLDYYNAADVFILTSLSEGSPVAVQKAFACGVPVLSTNVGYTAELMQEHHAGVIMPKTDYDQWEKNLINILEGNLPEPFDPALVIRYFSWPKVAQQFIDVFRSL